MKSLKLNLLVIACFYGAKIAKIKIKQVVGVVRRS
jgi:hypothetical protein